MYVTRMVRERLARRDYNYMAERGVWPGEGRMGEKRGVEKEGVAFKVGKEVSQDVSLDIHREKEERVGLGGVRCTDPLAEDSSGFLGEEGFKSRGEEGARLVRVGDEGEGWGVRRSSSLDRVQEAGASYGGGGSRGASPKSSVNRFAPLSSPEEDWEEPLQENASSLRYYHLLPNGDFDSETYEDEKE